MATEPTTRPRAARRARLRHPHRRRPARGRRRAAEGDVPRPPLRHRHRHRSRHARNCRGSRARSTRPALSTRRSSCPTAKSTKSLARLGEVVEGLLAAKLERGDIVLALGRRRDRRPRRLRRIDHPARHGLRADPDDAPGAGRLLGRRQDRHQLAARQEPHRRLPSAQARARRPRRARHARRRASSPPAMPRW